MATYDNLPVYKASYDLLVEIFGFVKTFPREYKYTIGEEIKKETLRIIQMVYRANSDRNRRQEYIRDARAHVETLRLYLRLSKDLNQIGLTRFVSLSEGLETISKQLYFWEEKTRA